MCLVMFRLHKKLRHTSGADDDIEFLNPSVDKFNSVGQDLFNGCGDEVALEECQLDDNAKKTSSLPYVIFTESFEVTGSRRQATASDRKIGNNYQYVRLVSSEKEVPYGDPRSKASSPDA